MRLTLLASPQAQMQWQRFKRIRRGYYSTLIFLLLLFLSAFAEIWVSNRPVVVSYQGHWYFPSYSAIIPGRTFGFDYDYETKYRELAEKFSTENQGDWLLMPLIPYNPLEVDLIEGAYPPYAPNIERRHYLGTDTVGRDVAARLIYGFRTAMIFSLFLLFCNYLIGVSLGCIMGYYGGKFDLFFQRIIEMWSNIPFLYVIMIISSIVVPNLSLLVLIMVFFGWMSMTWYMRTITFKEREREYVLAAKALGASDSRIIFKHILPNTVSVIVTFIPFSIASGISSLTALDYLGFGLPAPTPSWGELLRQGTNNLQDTWIVLSVVSAMTLVLIMVTYFGEAVREAVDPKKYTRYE